MRAYQLRFASDASAQLATGQAALMQNVERGARAVAGAALRAGLTLRISPLRSGATALTWGLIFALSLAGALSGSPLAASRM